MPKYFKRKPKRMNVNMTTPSGKYKYTVEGGTRRSRKRAVDNVTNNTITKEGLSAKRIQAMEGVANNAILALGGVSTVDQARTALTSTIGKEATNQLSDDQIRELMTLVKTYGQLNPNSNSNGGNSNNSNSSNSNKVNTSSGSSGSG